MFYEGSLRHGLARAVAQAKSVACFVRDSEEESELWENDFLKDPEIYSLLISRTVVLRLLAGSEEAVFLAALYPLPKTPTLVILHNNGQLKEYLSAGTSKEDFLRRVKAALAEPSPSSAATSSSPSAMPPLSNAGGSTPAQVMAPPEHEQSPEVRRLLEERRARMEAQQKQQALEDKKRRAAEKAARDAEINASASAADPQRASNVKYAQLQKKRQQDAREERARILKRVEDDKIERREKEALRKEQAKAAAMAAAGEEQEPAPQAASPLQSSSRAPSSTQCAIQVRLFDGTTVRSRFSPHDNLRTQVRKWVDEQRVERDGDGDVPYSFKQILTPLPNRTIGIEEEEDSLWSLGLCPSATLVLNEVKDFTSAYQGSESGIIGKSISTGYGLVSSGVGLVTGALGTFFGTAAAPAPAPSTNERTSAAISSSGRKQKGPEKPEEKQQFYNGNSLSFEPRPDNEDKRKDD